MTGAVFLDKPAGMTSFSAANRVRRALGLKKAGHTGTLDPMATGVLVVMLGGATRFIDFIPSHDKAYEASFRLGMTTDTLDTEGTVLTQTQTQFTRKQVEAVLPMFRGEIEQIPPMYSALKKDGQKLCDLARRGIEIERESRRVSIHELTLTEANEETQEFSIGVSCSAGTYIRSLIADIGERLGGGAVMTSLRRTVAHGVEIGQCVTLDEVNESCVVPLESLLIYPKVTVTAAQAKRFCCGGELDVKRLHGLQGNGLYQVLSPEGRFLGLGEIAPESEEMTIKRVLGE
ncbi:MAG TPA: tRNA pseudouridine(55) synthase TruB [Ruminococcaceae bacterium]|nr:tRNA pseudouridine(55) synthase TruB [Oscillospiraceae bacterium]